MDKSQDLTHEFFSSKVSSDVPCLGLILGGGGARGLAHIGVLKVLESQGIRVGCLAGASMGGLVAAMFAAGWSSTELEREALRMSRTSQLIKLIDLAPQRRGLLEGSRVRAYLAGLLGEALTIQDLPIPLAWVTVDLNTGSEVILQQGLLLDAVLATCTVPGLFPPVPKDGRMLVDGGLIDNLPIGAARDLGAQFTLAVDVSSMLPCEDEIEGESEWQPWPRLLPFFARDFFQAELILISTLTRVKLEQSPPDLLLRPEIPSCVSIFWGFSHTPQIIAAGEAAALQALPEIREALGG